jgi:dihydrofolate reductase
LSEEGVFPNPKFLIPNSMLISLIAAASENNVIGKAHTLPWDLPAELRYFRDTTRGKPVIMGRKTYDSIGRPMPGRHNIIITRDRAWKAEGCDTVTSVEDAIALAKADAAEEIFVIGGEQIYRLALPLADRIYLTRVHTVIEDGEAFFPTFDLAEWEEIRNDHHPADSENPIAYTIHVYQRKS